MKLIVVESPAKAKTLSRYLKGFRVLASMGHIRDLPEDDFGVDVDNEFSPTYVTIKGKEKTVKMIQKEAAGADEIYLGSDPDREGEAIAFHIAHFLKDKEKPIHRVLFHEITKSGVLKAIDEKIELNEDLFNAQQARRILDRIVGYRLSPFLWKSVKKGLSAGRVQSVALKFIVDREREIAAFVPEEYWNIKGLFRRDGGDTVDIALDKVQGQKPKIGNEREAIEIEKRIRAATGWKIESIEQKRRKENPLPPFNTSALQQEASRVYHFTADRIMRVAQSLYEGKEIGAEGPFGLITYMRTDSFRVSPEANAKLREFVAKEYGDTYLCPVTRTYENKKGKIQDAHEAIRPTDVSYTPEKVKPYLTKEELNIYTLIWRRFVATQMKEAEFDQTVVTVSDAAKDLSFRKTGSVMVFDGYRKIWERGNGREETLPAFTENEPLALAEVSKEQNFTKPPSRYTEGSLVKELEEKGIGRPSTYAAIINHIIARKYVDRLKEPKGTLGSTDLGGLVSDTLQQFFPKIINVTFTAEMEEKLDRIEAGEAKWLAVLKEFYAAFEENRAESLETLKGSGKKRIYAEENCPKCGGRLVVRFSKKGNIPFLSCEKYPDCSFSGDMVKEGDKIHLGENRRDEPQLLEEKCPNCGAQLAMKQGRFGPFKACSNYPKCKTIVREIEEFGPCPKKDCGGTVQKRRSQKGKVFYGCSNYPKCDFVSWYPPIAGQTCAKCGAAYMVEKKSGVACGICGEKVKS